MTIDDVKIIPVSTVVVAVWLCVMVSGGGVIVVGGWSLELFGKVFSLLDEVGSTFLLFLLHYVIYCDTLALFIIVNVIKACYSFVK